MSHAPISPLRRRMIEDMIVRGFGEKTQSDYLAFLGSGRGCRWTVAPPTTVNRLAIGGRSHSARREAGRSPGAVSGKI
jgi:hypothetical protein